LKIQRNENQELKFLNYFILPGGTYTLAFLCWLWLIEPNSNDSTISNIIYFVGLLAITYEVGFKGYLKANKKAYFYGVFIVPLCFSLIGVLGAYL